jgi:hypothetical protein
MLLYLVIIFISSCLIAGGVSLAFGEGYFATFGLTWLAIGIIVVINAIVATIARALPKSFADFEKNFFKVSSKEKNFLEKLKIRTWKDLIPEIGHFTGFRKNKILEPNNPKYIERFLLECCYGEIGHFWSIIFGFLLLLFFFISDTWIAISIPVAIIAGGLNLLPFMTLRYNSYKLRILRTSLLKKQKQEQNKIA